MERADHDQDEGAKSARERDALVRLLGGLGAGHSRSHSQKSNSESELGESTGASVAPKTPNATRTTAGRGQAGDVFGNRFEVLRECPTNGARGARFVAADRANDDREVLLELLDDPGNSKGLEIEQRLVELTERLRAFPRESTYALYASGRTHDGRIYLVSDLPQGETLADLHKRTGRLTSPHALEIAYQILGVLAQGHRRRLPHGRLRAATVFLDHHALGSAANPHGVAVRLVEFGLDDLFSAEGSEAATTREDIRAVGTILADLTWEPTGPNGRANTAGDNSITKIIERACSDDDGVGYRDADEMRRAIEALPGWHAQSNRGQRDLGWLVAAGAIAALALSLYYQFEPNAAELADQTDRQPELLVQQQLDRSQSVPREALEKSDGLRAQAQEELDLLTVRLGQLERDNVDLRIARDALTAERNSLRAQQEGAGAGVNGRPEDGTERVEQLEAQVAELQTAVEAGLSLRDSLLIELDALRANSEPGKVSPDDVTPDDVTPDIVTPDIVTPGDVTPGDVIPDDVTPGASGSKGTGSTPLLGAALEAPLALGLTDVAALASSASDDELMRALAAYGDAVASLVVVEGEPEKADDELNRARLEAIPALAAWTQIAAALGSELELQQIDLAQRYYNRTDPMGIPLASDLDLLLSEGELTPQTMEQLGGWRAELALSLALERAPGAITSPPGARALWLLRSDSGQVFWQFMESVPRLELSAGETRAWTTTEVRYDSAGTLLGERSYVLRQVGRRFEVIEAGQTNLLVDLARDEIQMNRYAPAALLDEAIDRMPAALGPTLEAVQSYRAGLVNRVALLRQDEDRQRWFIPGLGLVRFSSPGQLECELVYMDYPE